MAAIIAPIVARDEAESMLIKSANRTIQVRLTRPSSDQTQPDPINFKPEPNLTRRNPTKPNLTGLSPNPTGPTHSWPAEDKPDPTELKPDSNGLSQTWPKPDPNLIQSIPRLTQTQLHQNQTRSNWKRTRPKPNLTRLNADLIYP